MNLYSPSQILEIFQISFKIYKSHLYKFLLLQRDKPRETRKAASRTSTALHVVPSACHTQSIRRLWNIKRCLCVCAGRSLINCIFR